MRFVQLDNATPTLCRCCAVAPRARYRYGSVERWPTSKPINTYIHSNRPWNAIHVLRSSTICKRCGRNINAKRVTKRKTSRTNLYRDAASRPNWWSGDRMAAGPTAERTIVGTCLLSCTMATSRRRFSAEPENLGIECSWANC